ncbi:MAG: hypothetical protein COB02_01880 [Candidatus Cloacimonadota bacterium]|nr:MAG: hypothetical protein COB02_01880 [Candidatus Cloacimonadota bacterium]
MTKKAQKIDNLELEGLMKAVKANQLDEDQMKAIFEILSTFNDICSSLEEKRMSLKKLKDMLGIKTEKEPNSRGIANPPKKKENKL